MKKFLIYLIFIVFMVQPCLSALDPSIDNKKTWKNAYRFTNKPKDLFLDWCVAVEDALDGTDGISFLLLDPGTAPDPNAEGQLYYDDTGNVLYFRNETAWVELAASTASSLDSAYNSGQGITVDIAAMALSQADTAWSTLTITSTAGTTNDYDCVVITTAQAGYTGDSLYINGVSGSTDIKGDNWNMPNTGILVAVGGTFSSDVTLDCTTSAGKDVEWDDSRETLHFLDNSILGIGGATTAVADFQISHDATDVDVEVAADGAIWKWGDATKDIDMWWYGSDAADYMLWDEGAAELYFSDAHIQLADDGTIIFGSDNDWYAASASGKKLAFIPATGDGTDSFDIGADTAGADFKLFAADTSGAYVLWDSDVNQVVVAGSAQISLNDSVELLLGTGASNAGDFSLVGTSAPLLTFNNIVDGSGTVAFGASNTGLDVAFYGDAATAVMLWDENANTNGALIFNVCDIEMGDGDFIQFGDGADLTVSATTTTTTMTMAAGSDLDILDTDDTLSKVILGLAGGTHGLDIQWNSVTAADTLILDAGAETMALTGLDATLDDGSLAFGDGDEILLGDALGTGTFTISSTSAVLTIAQVSADTGTIVIGVTGGTDVPITWYGETNGADIILTGDTISLDGIDMTVEDGDFLMFGDGEDFTMTSATAANFSVNGAAADETDTFNFGADADGLLVLFHSATGSDLITWDAANEALEFVGVDLVMDTDSIATLDAVYQGVVVIPTAGAAYTCLENNSGQVHVIGEMDNDTTIDLPAVAAGLYYKFVYCSAATPAVDETHDHNIDTESDTNFFIGGVSFWDTDAGNGADETNAGVYTDGNSNSIFNLINVSAGTVIEVWCDGTNWYISGQVLSDTVPTFADQA